MDSPVEKTTGCGGEKVIIKDDDSLIERCWEEQYRGDSRKWLIRDGSYKNPRDPLCSTMQATYNFPLDEKDEKEFKDKRRANLVRKFYEEAREELLLEYNKPPISEDRNTEYEEKFQIPGFNIKEKMLENDRKLYEKYPLYSSNIVSYYNFNLMKRNPFKRNTSFTKPISERYENIEENV